jgi:hypothetical protein
MPTLNELNLENSAGLAVLYAENGVSYAAFHAKQAAHFAFLVNPSLRPEPLNTLEIIAGLDAAKAIFAKARRETVNGNQPIFLKVVSAEAYLDKVAAEELVGILSPEPEPEPAACTGGCGLTVAECINPHHCSEKALAVQA